MATLVPMALPSWSSGLYDCGVRQADRASEASLIAELEV